MLPKRLSESPDHERAEHADTKLPYDFRDCHEALSAIRCRFQRRSSQTRMAADFEEVEAAVAALRRHDTTLTDLELAERAIGDDGAAALADAVKVSATLTSLTLVCNSIGDAGAAALADAVKVSATLTTLSLGSNSISDAATEAASVAVACNEAFAERAPAERETTALAYLMLHAASRGAPPPNVVVSALAALRPRRRP